MINQCDLVGGNMSIGPVYMVMLDNHVQHSTFDYQDAKRVFLDWVGYMKDSNVSYKSVCVKKDQEVMLEYLKKA